MSIAVTESRATSVALDAIAELDDSYQRARESFAEDARKAFTEAFKGEMTMVDWVQYSTNSIKSQPARDAFMEELERLVPQSALWEMLKNSTCPYVAVLRESVIESYIEAWGDEVAEMRAGE